MGSKDEQRRRPEPRGATRIGRSGGIAATIDKVVPGTAPGLELVTVVAITCPWCNEPNETQVDITTGDLATIEDCTVCCQPMELTAAFADDGSLIRVVARR